MNGHGWIEQGEIDDERYLPYWKTLSKRVRLYTGGRCCYPGCNHPATEAHHILYGHFDGFQWQPQRIYIPGLMVVPLCDEHHTERTNPECAHHPDNWFKGTRANRFRDARNAEEYHLLLIRGWKEKLLPQYRRMA